MKSELIWFTTRQAGERAGRHPETIRRACETGELHGSQRTPGRSTWRIHRDCLEAWLFGRVCEHQVSAEAEAS